MRIKDKKVVNEYYQALVDRDPTYNHRFYAGVKTTAVFCISTCHARKPKFENVEFFTDIAEVLKNGYKACKKCNPTLESNEILT